MNITSILLGLVIVLNIFFAVILVFKERRDAGSTWAWLFVLFFIPLLGFVLYLILGRQGMKRSQFFQWEDIKKTGAEQIIQTQIEQIKSNTYPFRNHSAANNKDLILMNLENNNAVFTEDNVVELFTDGKAKFDRLFEDIAAAKDYIHLQYYIYQNDELGRKLIERLTEKAREGVKVRLLYDELGSRWLRQSFFKAFREAGGQAEAFFPSKFKVINLKINYRNHRKMVIIDGVTGYVGGFNVGDEYLGEHAKFGYWRDTHLRIQGEAVYALQTRFILDWNQATVQHDISYAPSLYPKTKVKGGVSVQVITSGPVSKYEHIKNAILRMIASAKSSIFIQTPYFIPDSSLLDALRIASLSGIDVQLMIPSIADHLFVHSATVSYAGELLESGVKVYQYQNGFLHAKMIVIDEEIVSVGTANMDVRSFRLNFEVNALLFDGELARTLAETFRSDIEQCTALTVEAYAQRSTWWKFRESISRLLSPIL